MYRLFFFLFILIAGPAFATHQRAGEITYIHLGGDLYEITITTYSNSCSIADDPDIEVNFGDGSPVGTAPRINGTGDVLGPCLNRNIYRIQHHYQNFSSSPYDFIISVELLNRKGSIVNIPNSIAEPLYLKTRLFRNPLVPYNNSPQFGYLPLDTACLGYCFKHIPLAHDPDGDSLRFELISCLGAGGIPIPGYFIPVVTNMDARTGELEWCSPYAVPNYFFPQEWNFAFLVHEYRKINGIWQEIGFVERDMQVTVVNCTHAPPVIGPINDVCTLEGNTVTVGVSANDPQDSVYLSAYGAPFSLNPPAQFISSGGAPTATGTFSWSPSCEQVRLQPYQVLIKAEDNNSNVALWDLQSFHILVIAKPPLNLRRVSQDCDRIALAWDSSLCDPVSNPVTGYRIYRDDKCNTWQPGACETGVPSYSGYELAASVNGISTTSVNIPGHVYGHYYSYRVVTVFSDGALSKASDPLCILPDMLQPVLTNVDVSFTGSGNGVMEVKWIMPPAGAGGYDTLAHPGPYSLELKRGTGMTGAGATIATFASTYYTGLTVNALTDVPLDTYNDQWVYSVALKDGNSQGCGASEASSVFLSIAPDDNALHLSWQSLTPWTNAMYEVWKEIPTGSGNWEIIAVVTGLTFTDTNLQNGATYCYFVRSVGSYSDPALPVPLYNRSQRLCGIPRDMTPPCPPSLSLVSECLLEFNQLEWSNPNLSCSDDVVAYNLYYASGEGADPVIIATLSPATSTGYIHDSLFSVAGCYYVTALDSFSNESPVSNRVCADNCPVYQLPNVFTPNGDGINDLFVPLPYRYVDEVDLKIYNRWGELVFATRDPAVNWNGLHMESAQPCSDGVYYYTCIVYEIRLNGRRAQMLEGFVHILGREP